LNENEKEDNRDNFKRWFSKYLEALYDDNDAGFVIMMITFPLLERYLRQKVGIGEGTLDKRFHTGLEEVFPSLKENDCAKDFWQARHTLLHQATLPNRKHTRVEIASEWVSSNSPALSVQRGPWLFTVGPASFAKKVLGMISADFETYEKGTELARVTFSGTSVDDPNNRHRAPASRRNS